VYTNTITRGTSLGRNEIVYERRLGARNQIEAIVPLDTVRQGEQWYGGLGDVAVAFRRTFLANARTGTIAAGGGELAFPTGNADRGLGNGCHVFEPFGYARAGTAAERLLQLHGGLEIPSDQSKAPKEAFLRTAIGVTYMADRGFGRSWSPQVEVLMAHPFGQKTEWDIAPQLQVSLFEDPARDGRRRRADSGQRAWGTRHGGGDLSALGLVVWPFTSFWK
jgi:hypothetical protein